MPRGYRQVEFVVNHGFVLTAHHGVRASTAAFSCLLANASTTIISSLMVRLVAESKKGGWPPCLPFPTTTKPLERDVITTTTLFTTTASQALAVTTTISSLQTTTALILQTPAPTTPAPSLPCGNGILEPYSSSCWSQVFGIGVKICSDMSALSRGATGLWYLLEECDDGNQMSGDGCSDICTLESLHNELWFVKHLLPGGSLRTLGGQSDTRGTGGEMDGFLYLRTLDAGGSNALYSSTGWFHLSYAQGQISKPSYAKGIYR